MIRRTPRQFFSSLLKRFLTLLNCKGFPRAWFSDSRSLLVLDAGMDDTALSVDLRDRVAAAIAGGLSRRQAAAPFGVSAATPDITLAELQALVADHGIQVALGTPWRFFDRRGITRLARVHATF